MESGGHESEPSPAPTLSTEPPSPNSLHEELKKLIRAILEVSSQRKPDGSSHSDPCDVLRPEMCSATSFPCRIPFQRLQISRWERSAVWRL